MKLHLVLPVVLGAVVLSAPAFAQSATDAAKCKTLEEQFDKGINPFHVETNDQNTQARNMRTDGGKLCDSGKATEGTTEIRNALQMWGVTPHA